MKRKFILMFAAFAVLLFGDTSRVNAQVKRVKMHVGGYLCGNWVYNIQKAVSRLDYAPKLKEVEITDIKKGLGVFVPKPDKAVSFIALKQTLKKAGYALDAADITISGKLFKEADKWLLISEPSGQKFLLESKTFERFNLEPDSSFEIIGNWKTVSGGATAQEVVEFQSAKKADDAAKAKTIGLLKNTSIDEKRSVRFLNANLAKFSPILIPGEENEIKDVEWSNREFAVLDSHGNLITFYEEF